MSDDIKTGNPFSAVLMRKVSRYGPDGNRIGYEVQTQNVEITALEDWSPVGPATHTEMGEVSVLFHARMGRGPTP